MASLEIRLFGKFSLQKGGHELECLQCAKAKELLCYLLLHRDRSHLREVLGSLLWGDCTTAQSRKYFRQTLWQLQQGLHEAVPECRIHALQVEGESVRFNSQPNLWLDIAAFEHALIPVRGINGNQIDTRRGEELRESVSLYAGDLLEGWYQDWCIYHRERLQSMYLAMVDKLMDYCEARQDYEAGITYGEQLLGRDRGRERTYSKMMRLHYLSGDRAGAIRQFHRCVAALEQELAVKPSKRTIDLYEQICADRLSVAPSALTGPVECQCKRIAVAPYASRLAQIRSILVRVQKRVRQDIRDVDRALAAELIDHTPRNGNPSDPHHTLSAGSSSAIDPPPKKRRS